jgi:methanogenic corrinoid protein MtbC1
MAGDDGDLGVEGAAEALNLKQVAQRLGVHYMTAYRYVRTGQLRATREGPIWNVDPAVLSAFEQQRAEAADAGPRPVDWVARLTDRLVVGDEAGAWNLVEHALVAGWSPDQAILGLIEPAVVAVQPAHGPAAGHLAATTATRTAAVLAGRFRTRGRRRGTIVLGAPAGESHSLGLALLADVLRIRGLAVLELGGHATPEAFLDAATGADRLVAVAIGVTDRERLWEAREVVVAVRAALPATAILLGGPAVADAAVAELAGADGWEPDLGAVAALVERLLGARARRSSSSQRSSSETAEHVS